MSRERKNNVKGEERYQKKVVPGLCSDLFGNNTIFIFQDLVHPRDQL